MLWVNGPYRFPIAVFVSDFPRTPANSFLLQFLTVLPTYRLPDSHARCLFPNAGHFPSLLPPSSALSGEHESFSSESCVIEWAAHAVSRPVALSSPSVGDHKRERVEGGCVCVAEANVTGYPHQPTKPRPPTHSTSLLLFPACNQNEHQPCPCRKPHREGHFDRGTPSHVVRNGHTHICFMHMYVYTHFHTQMHSCPSSSVSPSPWQSADQQTMGVARRNW